MSAEHGEQAERHSRGGVWTWLVWVGAALLLYLLSAGPVALLEAKGWFSKGSVKGVMVILYSPWLWAYEDTPLHKPLGMYLHLWVPQEIDKDGDQT